MTAVKTKLSTIWAFSALPLLTPVFSQDSETFTPLGSTTDIVFSDLDGDYQKIRGFSFSADGDHVAIGNPNGKDFGTVRVYKWTDSQWQQLGQELIGFDVTEEFQPGNDGFGMKLSLSGNGSRLAVSSPYASPDGQTGIGQTRVFEFSDTTWKQLGQPLNGVSRSRLNTSSISLSANGTRLAIGGEANLVGGENEGLVRVFELSGSAWVKVGSDIYGTARNERNGSSVSLSEDGSRLAIASTAFGGEPNPSRIRVYEYLEADWSQMGEDINAVGGLIGSVDLAADGNRLAIANGGIPGIEDIMGPNSVRIYDYTEGNWSQNGQAIALPENDESRGAMVSLSANGKRVAVSSTWEVGRGTNDGFISLYEILDDSLLQIGGTFTRNSIWSSGAMRTPALNADGSRLAFLAPSRAITDDTRAGNDFVSVYSVKDQTMELTVSVPVNGSVNEDAAGTYNLGETVTITATANGGYVFNRWTGDASGDDNPLLLFMDADKTISAVFEQDRADNDNDGTNNYQEITIYGTDPNDADTDDDGFNDGYEIAAGTNPLDKTEIPALTTITPILTNARALGAQGNLQINAPDGITWTVESEVPWITINGTNNGSGPSTITYVVARNTTSAARNGSIRVRALESGQPNAPLLQIIAQLAINPDADTDGDGLKDIVETNTGIFISPNDTGTDPENTDTDADSYNDNEEVLAGSNPLDAESRPTGLNPASSVLNTLGDRVSFQVNMPPGVRWTATTLSPWIIIEGPASGIGNGEVSYSAGAHFAKEPRAGQIRINITDGQTALGTLLTGDAQVNYLIPRDNALGNTWKQPDFDDSTWDSAPHPIGFESPNGLLAPSIKTNISEEMKSINASGYFRFPFKVDTSKRQLLSAKLYVNIDDGYIAYLNGVEVARFNTPAPILWNSKATGQRSDSVVLSEALTTDITEQLDAIVDGQNVLAIQAMNNAAAASDFFLRIRLESAEQLFSEPLFHSVLQPATNPDLDSDNDGLTDAVETNTGVFVSENDTGTDPNNPDTDADGLNDMVETNTGIFVSENDTGTNPHSSDTDSDGLGDAVETATGIFISENDTGTNPHSSDTDSDGLEDLIENNSGEFVATGNPGTNPNKADSDGDGLPDGEEARISYYSIINGFFQWQQAREDAAARGGFLATFATETKWNDALSALGPNAFDNYTGLWIGGTDSEAEGIWKWITGEPLGALNFPLTLIPQGAEWQYLDNGVDQGSAWKETEFDDKQWQTGTAEFGFGDGDESTSIANASAGDPIRAYYFRKRFDITEEQLIQLREQDPAYQLHISLKRDDGAVIYLNGKEIHRDNMPAGVITHSTLASLPQGGLNENSFFDIFIDGEGLLSAGENILAVSVHQSSVTSSDLSFNLGLDIKTDGNDIPPSFARWAPGQPDNLGEADVAEVSGGFGTAPGFWFDTPERAVRDGYILETKTDPNNPDTDGDGLNDGAEKGVGRFSTVRGFFNWESARADAVERGGNLATFVTADEWQLALDSLGEGAFDEFSGLWIGASDAQEEGNWKWITGENVQFENWAAGQPDNIAEADHAEVSGGFGTAPGFWFDTPGRAIRDGYILEKGTSTDPANPDSDGDGFSDGQEVTAGSNPNDPGSVPENLVSVPFGININTTRKPSGAIDRITLSFPSASGKSYIIEESADLKVWKEREGGIPGSGADIKRNFPPGSATWFRAREE